MANDSDSSSNDEQQNIDDGIKSDLLADDPNNNKRISQLILSIVERLTKICVICEGNSTSDTSSIKGLMKQIYKFEKTLKILQKVIQYNIDNSLDNGTVIKGLIRAVDNYNNPYDWLFKNIVEKCNLAENALSSKLDMIHELQKDLIERLQTVKINDCSPEG